MTGERETRVVVTGAAGDIGRAICRRLLDDGYTVSGVDVRDSTDAAELHEELSGRDGFEYERLDVTDPGQVTRLIDRAPDLGALVGNAGIVEPQPILELDDEALLRQLQVNLVSNIRLGRLFARRLIGGGDTGAIVYIGSWVGDRAWPELVAYSASKAGLAMAARNIALELAPRDIRVNVVAPGIVDAGLARAEAQRNPEYAARAAAAVPLGRLQTTDDVAGVTSFLLSPEARNITGSMFVVDGGCSLGRHDAPQPSEV